MPKLCINKWISRTNRWSYCRDETFSCTSRCSISNTWFNNFGFQETFLLYGELTAEERLEYIELICSISEAQRKLLGIEKVYYFYNEDTTHHFHLWLVPRYEWMYEFGNSVESLRPVLLHARNNLNNEDNMKQVIAAITKIKEELNGVKTDLL